MNCSWLVFSLALSLLLALGVILAVTLTRGDYERRRLEQEKELVRRLFQRSKLESLGELSAGLAREIDDPLNCIMNFAHLLKDDSESLEESQKVMVKGIIDESERISAVVKDIFTFARPDSR